MKRRSGIGEISLGAEAGIRNLTQEDANSIQAMNVSHATQDLYEAIERKRLSRVGAICTNYGG